MLKTVLQRLGGKWLHHGDCIVADAKAHEIGKKVGYKVELHPPEKSGKRAFCKDADKVNDPKPYLVRNHNIVDATEIMIGIPESFEEVQRSGTWATIRYARKQKKPIVIIWPDGSVMLERVKR
jgi:hypothetical protein